MSSPYVDPSEPGETARAEINGAELVIGGEAVTNLALVLHELATNAAKYGALSLPDGRVHISWTVKKGHLALTWEERGGPPLLDAPTLKGFGSLLAHRSIGGHLEGELEFDWKSTGLVARISVATDRLRS